MKRPSRLTKPLYRFSRKAHQSEKGWDTLFQGNQMEFLLSIQIDLVGKNDGNLFIGQLLFRLGTSQKAWLRNELEFDRGN